MVSQSSLPNSYWVVPERLLAGEYPAGRDEEATFRRLRRLLDAGINCFVDLTMPGELDPYEKLLAGTDSPDAVAYLRKPIRDHGLPESTGQMEGILDALDSALDQGMRVYLHCRAGIGRTNLVAGCWLARGGLGGEAALRRLNELWRQGGRAQSWPTVPETEAQSDYVRSWRSRRSHSLFSAPVSPPAPMAAMAASASGDPRDRCRGLLLGLAMGDALGQPARGKRPVEVTGSGDLAGGGPYGLPAGAWSDKTAMALCLAESLVSRKGMDAGDQLQRYLLWQRDGRWSSTGRCIGMSAATARALATAQWTGNPYSGSHDPARADAEPLARIGPAVIASRADPLKAIECAVDCARITHQAPLTLDAVRYLAALLAGALAGTGKDELLAPDFSPVAELWESVILKPSVKKLAAGSWRKGKPGARMNDAYAAACALEAALWAFEGGNSPAECLSLSASLGGDADTTAAIVGQLAGAHYGATAFPPAWCATIARGQEIQAIADALYETGMKPA